MSRLALFLLGSPRVEIDGTPIHIGRSKAVALLAYLAIEGGRHRREALATLLWPEYDHSRARADLRRTLSQINRALGEGWIDADRESAGMDAEREVWLDVDAFRQHLTQADAHGHARTTACAHCLPLLEQATALYRGDFMAGFTLRDSLEFDEWQFFQTQSLRDRLAGALERLIAWHGAQGAFDRAIAHGRHWLALDPAHELAHRQLMALHSQAGQQAAALRQYEVCRQTLADELGLEPAPETRALYERIRAGNLSGAAIMPSPQHNLPAQTTPLIGREIELAELDRLLTDPGIRLVTILGPGGMGKTHLALEAASAQLDRFSDGVYLVPLTPLDNPDQIVAAIAETINLLFGEGDNPKQQLLDHLRQKSMLLVLDNFEHLLPPHEGGRGGAALVVEMLRAAPDLRTLVTSRESLKAQGEQMFSITGLAVPQKVASPENALQFGAVQLFLQSARRARPNFKLMGDNMHDVVHVCRLVEGMPLGILLAAAWVEVLNPSEIAQEIIRSLDFLETELQDAPSRHRSIRGVFDHSWMLLPEREQQIFQALSVFRGGFTRLAAKEVAQSSIQALRSLVNKSLLIRTSTDRYEIHELLRQYAAEKLSQNPTAYEAAREAHSAFYCTFLHQRENELKGAQRLATLMEMRTERENALAAWNWAVANGQTEFLGQALESLGHYYDWRGRYQEGEEALRMMAERIASPKTAGQQRLLVRALIWQADFNRELGRTELAMQLSRQSLDLLDSPLLCDQETRLERAAALYSLGSATLRHDYDKARRLWQQSFELYRAVGDRWGMADVLGRLGMIAWELGRYDEAKQLIEEDLVIQQAVGNQVGMGDIYSTLGWIALTQGQFEQAEKMVQESTARYREIGDQARVAKGLRDSAAPKLYMGQFSQASSLLKESIAMFNKLGGGGDLVFAHILLGATTSQLGQYAQARDQEVLGLELARKFEDRAGVGRALLWLGRVALVEEAGAEAQRLFRESIAVFRELGLKDQMSSALASLGHSARSLGNPTEARQYLADALQTAIEIGAFLPLLFAIPLAALLTADRGETERAIELYASASRYSFVANSRWCKDVFGRHIMAVAATLPSDVVAAAQAREQSRNLWAAAYTLMAEMTS